MEKKLYDKDLSERIIIDTAMANNHILFESMKIMGTNYDSLNPDGSYLYPNKEYWDEFNSLNYRCDEFIKNHDGTHILFMGCSETQGCNHGLDEAWANILYKKIEKNEKLSGYFNLGTTGHGVVLQILHLLQYIENYGKPDEIFFLVPETIRAFILSQDKNNENYGFIHINLRGKEDNYDLDTIMNVHFNSLILLRFLESFCENAKIKLIWSTWDLDSENTFIKLNFKNYLDLNNRSIEKIFEKDFEKYANPNKSVQYNLVKRDWHRGLAFHNYWAEQFYNRREYEKNNKKN